MASTTLATRVPGAVSAQVTPRRYHHVLEVVDVHLGEIGDHAEAVVFGDEVGRIGQHRTVHQLLLHADEHGRRRADLQDLQLVGPDLPDVQHHGQDLVG